MNNRYPLVGIPSDVKRHGLSAFQGVGEKYINAVVHGSDVCPILIPAQGPGEDLEPMDEHRIIETLMENIQGLFLSGSTSNVQPSLYSNENSLTPDDHDPQRDSMSLAMIRAALKKKMPILAVCRGIQELNVALGGTLHQKVHELEGMMDHQEDKTLDRNGQYQAAHSIKLVSGKFLSGLVNTDTQIVNSLHGQGLQKLGTGLIAEAHAQDGLVEAISLADTTQYVLGVQWHPEWQFRDNALSCAIFKSFGDAVRDYNN
ncbi:MAG: putative glutamine amidotransferase [Enterobacterales bacterium]|jgi:putative glutamine amidotransferase